MRLVIDSNEYIFAFGPIKKSVPALFLDKVLASVPLHSIHIPRTVFIEVRRNLSPIAFGEFFAFLSELTVIDEDFLVPYDIDVKYERMGLKMADAFIAAYAEWVGADALVTENRHFLSKNPSLPFKVLSAEKCLKLIS